jgi:hypothetical protein
MLGEAGVTAIEVSTFGVTLSAALPLTPLKEAVTVVEPAATPVASPAALITAAAVVELVQVTVEVITAVEPSL